MLPDISAFSEWGVTGALIAAAFSLWWLLASGRLITKSTQDRETEIWGVRLEREAEISAERLAREAAISEMWEQAYVREREATQTLGEAVQRLTAELRLVSEFVGALQAVEQVEDE